MAVIKLSRILPTVENSMLEVKQYEKLLEVVPHVVFMHVLRMSGDMPDKIAYLKNVCYEKIIFLNRRRGCTPDHYRRRFFCFRPSDHQKGQPVRATAMRS